MAQRIPFSFDAEYRGQAAASEFADRETGELRQLAPNLKFEYLLADGEPDVIAFRQTALDKVASFDAATLQRGDYVHLEGVITLGRGQERSYAVLMAAVRADEEMVRAA